MGMGWLAYQWPPQIPVLGEEVSTGPQLFITPVNINGERTEYVQLGGSFERLSWVEYASLFREDPESQTSQQVETEVIIRRQHPGIPWWSSG